MGNDRITVIEPNGVKRTIPLLKSATVIGRGDNCEVKITYSLVSRYHAQITREHDGYYVTDLGTTNGTYLDNNRLEPNIPIKWLPNRDLRIGEVTLQLEQDMVHISRDFEGTVFANDLSSLQNSKSIHKSRRNVLLIGVAVLVLVIIIIVVGFLFFPVS